jgi:hypothetical protein
MGIAAHTVGVEGVLSGNFENYETPRGYLPGPLAIYRKGAIAVPVATAVTAGDPVFLHTAAGDSRGMFRSDNAGGSAIEITSIAAWRGSAEAGQLCTLYIDVPA